MKKIVLLAFLSFAAMVHAADSNQTPVIKDKKMEELKSEYGLTPEQEARVKQSREKFKPLIEQKEAAFKAAQEKFSASINRADTSTDELSKLFRQKMDATNALYAVHFQSRMEFRDILTSAQRDKMIAKYNRVKRKKPEIVKPAELPELKKEEPVPSIDAEIPTIDPGF